MIVSVEIGGLKFFHRDDSNDEGIIRSVLEHNGCGFPEYMHGWNVIDIGSHVGASVIQAAQRGARVWAFEPSAESYALLVRNIAENKMRSRITPFPLGVGEAGIHKLYLHLYNLGMHSLYQNIYDDLSNTFEVVHLFSLAQVFGVCGVLHCDLLKLDCEGCERTVVNQIIEDPSRIQRIQMELHHEATEKQYTLSLLEPYYTITPHDHYFSLELKHA